MQKVANVSLSFEGKTFNIKFCISNFLLFFPKHKKLFHWNRRSSFKKYFPILSLKLCPITFIVNVYERVDMEFQTAGSTLSLLSVSLIVFGMEHYLKFVSTMDIKISWNWKTISKNIPLEFTLKVLESTLYSHRKL